jgi:hypothetical protein
MSTFTLPTGRKVEKNATHCVAVKTRGRWNHQWFKSDRGAQNEIKRLRSYSADTVDLCKPTTTFKSSSLSVPTDSLL